MLKPRLLLRLARPGTMAYSEAQRTAWSWERPLSMWSHGPMARLESQRTTRAARVRRRGERVARRARVERSWAWRARPAVPRRARRVVARASMGSARCQSWRMRVARAAPSQKQRKRSSVSRGARPVARRRRSPRPRRGSAKRAQEPMTRDMAVRRSANSGVRARGRDQRKRLYFTMHQRARKPSFQPIFLPSS